MKRIISLLLILAFTGGIMMAENPKVVLSTSKGDITLELYKDKAPVSVENFLTYTKEGFYNNTVFHRVIADFMIQGGGFDTDAKRLETHDPIKNEADNGLKNDIGTIAMARTRVVDSATSQFFINTKDNDFLNHGSRDFGYAVFGKVIEGMDVVNKIQYSATGSKMGMRDWPLEDIVIKEAKILMTEE